MKQIKQLSGIFTVLVSLISFTDSANAVNIVKNGDFESTNIGNKSFEAVPSGSNKIQDWEVDGTSVDIVSSRIGATRFVFSGEQAIDMAGTPGPGSIFQDLTTTPNTTYDLSFYASSNGKARTNGLSVLWNGALIDTVSTPKGNTWEFFEYQVSATSNSTRLEFVGNISGFEGSLIDNVTVEEAPEPLTILGTATALGFGTVFKRKSLKKKAKSKVA